MTTCPLHLQPSMAPVWVAFLAFTFAAEGRSWTSSDGKIVEAEFVELSEDGKSVLLDISGRRFSVPLERLSDEDRDYLADLERSENASPADGAEVSQKSEAGLSEKLLEERIWTARDGTTVKARLIRVYSGTVLLREEDRSRRVRFYDLSIADRRFLSKAYAEVGDASAVPPVRPELVDLAQESPESASTEASAPEEMPPSSTEGNQSKTTDGISLPASGFGSLESSADEREGASTSVSPALGKPIVLPPSGFGSLEKEESPSGAEPVSTDEPQEGTGAEIVLPPSGFGSVDQVEAGSADDFFDEAGNGSADGDVKTPQRKMDSPEMLPESGFGSVPPDDATAVDTGFGNSETAGSPKLPPDKTPIAVDTRGNVGNPPRQVASQSDLSHSPDVTSSPTSSTTQPSPIHHAPPRRTGHEPGLPNVDPVELSGARWNLRLFGVVLLSGGCFLVAASYLWLITLAFLESFRGGLRSLVPGTIVMFTLTDSDQSNTPLMTLLLGGCLALGGCGLLLS